MSDGLKSSIGNNENSSFLITYYHKTQRFIYSEDFQKVVPCNEEYSLYEIFQKEKIMPEKDILRFKDKLIEVAESDKQEIYFEEFLLDFTKIKKEWHRVGIIGVQPKEVIHIVFTNVDCEMKNHVKLLERTKIDELTGLLNRAAFVDTVKELEERDNPGCALLFLDIVRFKAINELFGVEQGNELLKYIGESIRNNVPKGEPIARLNADRFVIYTRVRDEELEDMISQILRTVAAYELNIKVMCNMGVYITEDEKISVDAMIDRANLALSAIKGSYAQKFIYYNESLRSELISEQEIAGNMVNALAEKQFLVYYQPKYDHSTGRLLSAEALVRWKHPAIGIISPGLFIPIFEKNGFITKVDYYVFEQVCIFLKKCMETNLPLIPVSVNFSRHDIFQPDFIENLESIRNKYDVPVKFLHVEITESAVVGNSQSANKIVKKLHEYGYIVEMDDFGSGYSSLNVLKEIDFDIVKLDMMFMSNEPGNNRGGTILSSMVRMAKWLGMPVIAEGVETVTQADFLKSVGCNYIQGYLYSRPLPEEDYIKKLSGSIIGEFAPQMRFDERLSACNFWDPNSIETLIFSNYVGAATIFTYDKGKLEILRVNQRYLKELGMNLSEKDLIESDPWTFFDEKNKKEYEDMLKRAILSGEDEECENWRTISSDCCGEEIFCIRTTVKVIGKSEDCYMFHGMIRNITAEKLRYNDLVDNEKRFKATAEQVNVYFWEYDIATKEMRPCFRCMRDLGMPALLRNYPESAYDMGVFPPEVREMYSDWIRQLEEGVPSIEGVVPLTVGRVPFMVRYTTEFDDNGHPVKAYGSATLIVE